MRQRSLESRTRSAQSKMARSPASSYLTETSPPKPRRSRWSSSPARSSTWEATKMKPRVFALSLVVLASFGFAQKTPFELDADLKPTVKTGVNCIIKNVQILTVTKGDIEVGDILVRGGKIAQIGRNLSAPAG